VDGKVARTGKAAETNSELGYLGKRFGTSQLWELETANAGPVHCEICGSTTADFWIRGEGDYTFICHLHGIEQEFKPTIPFWPTSTISFPDDDLSDHALFDYLPIRWECRMDGCSVHIFQDFLCWQHAARRSGTSRKRKLHNMLEGDGSDWTGEHGMRVDKSKDAGTRAGNGDDTRYDEYAEIARRFKDGVKAVITQGRKTADPNICMIEGCSRRRHHTITTTSS
jgi:hypothetical protein